MTNPRSPHRPPPSLYLDKESVAAGLRSPQLRFANACYLSEKLADSVRNSSDSEGAASILATLLRELRAATEGTPTLAKWAWGDPTLRFVRENFSEEFSRALRPPSPVMNTRLLLDSLWREGRIDLRLGDGAPVAGEVLVADHNSTHPPAVTVEFGWGAVTTPPEDWSPWAPALLADDVFYETAHLTSFRYEGWLRPSAAGHFDVLMRVRDLAGQVVQYGDASDQFHSRSFRRGIEHPARVVVAAPPDAAKDEV